MFVVSINAQTHHHFNTISSNEIENLNDVVIEEDKEMYTSTSLLERFIVADNKNNDWDTGIINSSVLKDVNIFQQKDINSQKSKKFNSISKVQSSAYDFGTVANFIIFSGAGAVANTGVSTFTGDVGSHAGAIAGFGAPSVLNGTIERCSRRCERYLYF